MARHPKRRRLNDAIRRKPIRNVHVNARDLHLSAIHASLMRTLHKIWSKQVVFANYWMFYVGYFIVFEQILSTDPNPNNNAFDSAVDGVRNFCAANACLYVALVRQWTEIDHLLFDIPLTELLLSLEFTPRKHLRLGNIDNMYARKLTHFTYDQLMRLYTCFGLRDYCVARGEDYIYIESSWDHRRRQWNRYQYDPEELFLYTLCRLAKGVTQEDSIDTHFGGAYSRWSYGYVWMLIYLDHRYQNIIGHQGLLRFLHDFPRFYGGINRYCQREYTKWRNDGSSTTFTGLNFCPLQIFGFIDDSIDRVCRPFSGPNGDFPGAPRKPEYNDAQRSIFSGYIHAHGIKVETVFLPNGISTVFGPVSARCNDSGVLRLSRLDEFLAAIQHGENELYKALGDGAFSLGLQCITSYFRAIGRHFQLSDYEEICNHVLKRARITIEKNYGETSCIFRVCAMKENYKLGKKVPYCEEQLRVCHLLLNCYNCLNGDQAGSDNTFGLSPPRLEEYLQL